ncbi:DpnD/PcfM family protein [uncultured Capnocytophaga sp.]|uniref:DpnD/PcfM family protein n=1 Tax=uncultured Capnocytophaga sp. TaxID=159273 RepID=UPI00261C8823|nr:DpnD/PcfM family protein [uncultured Capnocytophaga sp.]
METFKIIIQELLSRTVSVQAQNIEEAIEKVNQMYKNAEIVLDAEDFEEKEIIPVTLKDEKEVLIKEIIEYLYENEKRLFKESEKPNNHIFYKIDRLRTLID